MDISEIIKNMGIRMRKARQLKQDRQKDLAARMGVSRLTVMKMEKGGPEAGRIPLETWLQASEHLNLLDSWPEVMSTATDPFEEFDRRVRDEAEIRKKRVRKPRRT